MSQEHITARPEVDALQRAGVLDAVGRAHDSMGHFISAGQQENIIGHSEQILAGLNTEGVRHPGEVAREKAEGERVAAREAAMDRLNTAKLSEHAAGPDYRKATGLSHEDVMRLGFKGFGELAAAAKERQAQQDEAARQKKAASDARHERLQDLLGKQRERNERKTAAATAAEEWRKGADALRDARTPRQTELRDTHNSASYKERLEMGGELGIKRKKEAAKAEDAAHAGHKERQVHVRKPSTQTRLNQAATVAALKAFHMQSPSRASAASHTAPKGTEVPAPVELSEPATIQGTVEDVPVELGSAEGSQDTAGERASIPTPVSSADGIVGNQSFFRGNFSDCVRDGSVEVGSTDRGYHAPEPLPGPQKRRFEQVRTALANFGSRSNDRVVDALHWATRRKGRVALAVGALVATGAGIALYNSIKQGNVDSASVEGLFVKPHGSGVIDEAAGKAAENAEKVSQLLTANVSKGGTYRQETSELLSSFGITGSKGQVGEVYNHLAKMFNGDFFTEAGESYVRKAGDFGISAPGTFHWRPEVAAEAARKAAELGLDTEEAKKLLGL